MTRQRYSIKESVNRILRSFQGTTISSDQPETLPGEVLSENEALSDLAELMEGSLPNQSLFIPNAMSLRFGEVYAQPATGTSQALVTGTWTQVTGFAGNGLSSDGVTPDQANDRITLNLAGTYFAHFGISMEAPNGTATTYHFELALDGVRQDAVSAKRGLGASGAIVGNVNASGFISATAGQNVTLYVLTQDANRVLHTHEMQMNVIKVA